MQTMALDTLRRLVGACRGVPRLRARRPAAPAAGPNLIYRLKAWPQLPESGRTADVYRMLSVMSNRPVNRNWILARSRMTVQQLDDLLRHLVHAGAVEVIDPARFAGREPCRA